MPTDSVHFSLYDFVGQRLNKNVFTRKGTLLLPAFSILEEQDVPRLINHGITLAQDDFEMTRIEPLVNTAIAELKELFQFAEQNHRVALSFIESRLLPAIIELSKLPNMARVLAQLESYDEYTYKHSVGVALLARMIGKSKGLTARQLDELTLSGFLHDIGKVDIPSAILNKPDKLTYLEFEQMKRHTVYGYHILRNTDEMPDRVALAALQHHEREDGSGYPYGLKGVQLDLYSKIVAIADIFHAMVSKRGYKESAALLDVLTMLSDHRLAGWIRNAASSSFAASWKC